MGSAPNYAERRKELALQSYSEHIDEASKHLQLQAEFGLSALKSSVLVNGGAIIALLTLVGGASTAIDQAELVRSIASFSGGLVLAMLGMIAASSSQSFFFGYWKGLAWEAQAASKDMQVEAVEETDLRWGNALLLVANAAAVFSIGAFVAGAAFGVLGLS